MTMTAKITSKGQVTIPKKVRDILKSNTVEFELMDGNVIIRPVPSLGGSLRLYARGYTALDEVRGEVWEGVTHDKTSR